jgi:RNA polymerase sigma factor (sigma-70 family)
VKFLVLVFALLWTSIAFMPIFDETSDCTAFQRLGLAAQGGAGTRDAQQLLYQRHAPYLLGVLRGRAARLLSLTPMTAEDLLHETFFRAFSRSDSYRCGEDGPSVEESRRTRAWLGKIAERLLLDAVRATHETPGIPDMDDVVDEGPASSGTSQAGLVRDALSELSEREQDILRVTALFYRVGEEHQRLPNDVAAQLSRTWQTSSENIRAIRKRAMAKVKKYVEERLTEREVRGASQ